jgi:hypothetical protein
MKLTRPKSGKILKIMGPHESLSEDISNKYQRYRVSIASKIFIIFLFYNFGDRSRNKSEIISFLTIASKRNTAPAHLNGGTAIIIIT